MSKGTVPARLRVHMTPGEMLRTVRELQEMTQAELAEASGVSQPVISAVENELSPLGLERGRKLADALRVHPAVLLFPDWEPVESYAPPLAKALHDAKPSPRAVKSRRA